MATVTRGGRPATRRSPIQLADARHEQRQEPGDEHRSSVCRLLELTHGDALASEAEGRTALHQDLVWLAALCGRAGRYPLVALAFGGLLPGFPPTPTRGRAATQAATSHRARDHLRRSRPRPPAAGSLAVAVAGVLAGAVGVGAATRKTTSWVIAATAALASCLLAVVILNIEEQAPAGAVGLAAPPQPAAAAVPRDRLDRRRGRGRCRDRDRDRGEHRSRSSRRRSSATRERQSADRYRRGGAVHALAVLTWLLLGERTWENSAWEIEARARASDA